jgi:hypothetical protein
MIVSIEVSNEQLVALKAKAAARGLTLQDWLYKLASEESESHQAATPFQSGYGMLAKYGPAPSAEEIDENRRDMFAPPGPKYHRSAVRQHHRQPPVLEL